MKKHYNRKYSCKKHQQHMFMSDDQLLCLSLMPYYNNIHKIDLCDIEYLKDSKIIDQNKEELFEQLRNVEKNNIKSCIYCNKEYPLLMDLKKHIIINCFWNELQKRIKIDNEKNKEHNIDTDINGSNNSLNNSTTYSNNTHSNNNSNNINSNNTNNNIYVDIKQQSPPVPFDGDWDISKISMGDKSMCMISQFMYTELLQEILKNEINLNVIIDKDKDSGMVYKNDIEKYMQMKLKDIISNTMDKLNNHLNDINKSQKNALKEITTYSRQIINKKHNDYKNNETIQEGVMNCMTNIYESKKEEATNIAKKVIANKKVNKIEQY
jgi:hypothetical protein